MKKPLIKLNRKKFLAELAAFGQEQRDLIEARVSGFAVGELASAERRRRARWDYQFFCETYFPHFVSADAAPSVFQQWAYKVVPAMMLAPGARVPVAAPRGEGKSTLLVQLHALWRVVNGYTHYTIMTMDSERQALMMLEAIKSELEANPRLRQDYPEVCGRGRLWQSAKIITANGRMAEIFGAGKRIRGRRFGAHRPDLALIDDLESDDLVRSKEQRDKREDWLRKAVGNLGPPDGSMCQLYVGTILHVDSVLARTLKNPLWKTHARVFSSIIRWPDRMDLWDRWQELLLNDGDDAAQIHYHQNRAAMEAGAQVSWPGTRPLLALMKLRAEDPRAFDTEHQNEPNSAENCPFSGVIQFWVQPCRDWVYFGAHDPSMGKYASRGDPSASLVGGYDRNSGKLDVVEALIARRTPDRQIEDIIRLQLGYNCRLWGIETVQFQEFFRAELVKRSAERNIHVPARGIVTSTDKALRIESLQPHVVNGYIRLGRNQKTLVAQLGHWPEAENDDGPDALEMLWNIARKGLLSVRTSVRTKPRSDSVDMRGHP